MQIKHPVRAAAVAVAVMLGTNGAAMAQSSVALGSTVYVERLSDNVRLLEPASRLARGDRVVTVLTWRRTGNGRTFTVTNPLPSSVYYQSSASDQEDVSADGGRTWGKLGSLRFGERMATAEDVTHLRWRIASTGPSGRIAYSAIVR